MPATTERKRRGPAPLPPLEKARYRAARRRVELREIEHEFEASLGLHPGDEKTAHGAAVLAIAGTRLKLSAELDVAAEKVNGVLRRGQKLSAKEYEAARNTRDALFYELAYEVPMLGLTPDMWEALTADDKKHRLGRPKLSLERRLLRARKNFQSALDELRAQEKISKVKPTDLNDVVEISKIRKLGRPGMNGLDAVDKQIRRKKRQLEYATSPEAEENYEAAIAAGIGRKPRTPRQVASDLRREIRTLQAEIKARESKLEPVPAVERQLKLARHNAYTLRRQAREDGETSKLNSAIRRAELKVDKLTEELETAKEAVKKLNEKKSGGAEIPAYQGAGTIPASAAAPSAESTSPILAAVRKLEDSALKRVIN